MIILAVIKMWWHCFLASLGDGLNVLFIFAVGWILLRRQDWFEKPGVQGYILMLVVGLMIGAGIEWVMVHVLRRWAYTTRMSLVPKLGIGIVPVTQMLVLPPLTFRVVTMWRKVRVRY